MTDATLTIPDPAAAAASSPPSAIESKLDAVLSSIGTLVQVLTPAAPAAATGPSAPRVAMGYSGPVGAGNMAAPLQPNPDPPKAPNVDSAPHPGETFQPGELGYYEYHDGRDKLDVNRHQLVVVTHVTEHHVHGLVLGDSRNVASFAPGQLTHDVPAGA